MSSLTPEQLWDLQNQNQQNPFVNGLYPGGQGVYSGYKANTFAPVQPLNISPAGQDLGPGMGVYSGYKADTLAQPTAMNPQDQALYNSINATARQNPGTLYGVNPTGNSYAVTFPNQAQTTQQTSQGQGKGSADSASFREGMGKGGASTATNTEDQANTANNTPQTPAAVTPENPAPVNANPAAPAAAPATPATPTPAAQAVSFYTGGYGNTPYNTQRFAARPGQAGINQNTGNVYLPTNILGMGMQPQGGMTQQAAADWLTRYGGSWSYEDPSNPTRATSINFLGQKIPISWYA